MLKKYHFRELVDELKYLRQEKEKLSFMYYACDEKSHIPCV